MKSIPKNSYRKNTGNPRNKLATNAKIIATDKGEVLKINGTELTIEDLSKVNYDGEILDSFTYITIGLMYGIESLQQSMQDAYKMGYTKQTDLLAFSHKSIVKELASIYKCSTTSEVCAHILSDLFKLKAKNEKSELITFMETIDYSCDYMPLSAYIIALSLYPIHLYRLAYCTGYALFMAESYVSDTNSNDKVKQFNNCKKLNESINIEARYSIIREITNAWLRDISVKTNLGLEDKLDEVQKLRDSVYRTDDSYSKSHIYKYVMGKIGIDEYKDSLLLPFNSVSRYNREKLLGIIQEEAAVKDTMETIQSLSKKQLNLLNNVMSMYDKHKDIVSVENAIIGLVKYYGDSLFKEEYIKLLENSKEYSKLEAKLSQELDEAIKIHAKEKRAFIRNNEKLEKNIIYKDKEIEKLKSNNISNNIGDNTSEQLLSLENRCKEFEEEVTRLTLDIGTRAKKYDNLLSESDGLKRILTTYGIDYTKEDLLTISEVLCTDEEIVDEGTSLEDKLEFINQFKLAMCGNRKDFVDRLATKGINNICHIGDIGDCKKNARYDLYIISSDCIGHTLRWQIETKVKEQNALMVYCKETNFEHVVNAAFRALNK